MLPINTISINVQFLFVFMLCPDADGCQFSFPFAYNACCQCIAQHIGCRPEHIAKMINRQNQCNSFRWYFKHSTGSHYYHQGCPGYTGNSFTGQHQYQQHGYLCANIRYEYHKPVQWKYWQRSYTSCCHRG